MRGTVHSVLDLSKCENTECCKVSEGCRASLHACDSAGEASAKASHGGTDFFRSAVHQTMPITSRLPVQMPARPTRTSPQRQCEGTGGHAQSFGGVSEQGHHVLSHAQGSLLSPCMETARG